MSMQICDNITRQVPAGRATCAQIKWDGYSFHCDDLLQSRSRRLNTQICLLCMACVFATENTGGIVWDLLYMGSAKGACMRLPGLTNCMHPPAGLEESNSRHTSPRIGARKSPLPSEKLSEPLIPKHPIATPDSPSREVRAPFCKLLIQENGIMHRERRV